MRAMLLQAIHAPLRSADLPLPEPGVREVRVRVRACGVCRTDLHILDGEVSAPRLPLVPGHQIVGVVESAGSGATRFRAGDRVGVPWLGSTCGVCGACRRGSENLCSAARFTGLHVDGGYAEHAIAHEDYCFAIPAHYSDVEAAPLLCAGMIGYRALRLAGDAERLGFYGFGASAHLLAQVAGMEGRRVFAFTRPGDRDGQRFALECGVAWAGDSTQEAPEPLDAAILFAPVGALVPRALAAVRPGGVVVCAGIHMSDIPAFPYRLLWEERMLRSVANLTRRDGSVFLALAARTRFAVQAERFPLESANDALAALRSGSLRGSAVLVI